MARPHHETPCFDWQVQGDHWLFMLTSQKEKNLPHEIKFTMLSQIPYFWGKFC